MTDTMASAALALLLADPKLTPAKTAGLNAKTFGGRRTTYVYEDGSAIVANFYCGPRGKRMPEPELTLMPAGSNEVIDWN
jgi:hypothetical protein